MRRNMPFGEPLFSKTCVLHKNSSCGNWDRSQNVQISQKFVFCRKINCDSCDSSQRAHFIKMCLFMHMYAYILLYTAISVYLYIYIYIYISMYNQGPLGSGHSGKYSPPSWSRGPGLPCQASAAQVLDPFGSLGPGPRPIGTIVATC